MTIPHQPPPPGLAEAVRAAARSHPDRTALTFLDYTTDRAGTATPLTYGRLDAQARAVAGALSRSVVPGDRAAILCPHGPDYVAALLGCLYTGVLAVPLYAPEAFRTDERLLEVMADCTPAALLTTTAYERSVRQLPVAAVPAAEPPAGHPAAGGPAAGRLLEGEPAPGGPPAVLCVDAVDPALARGVALPVAERPDDVAYLQYTSGSTRSPAGVEVTHRNLAVGVAQLRAGLGIDEDSRIAGWLPFFHDMGLLMMLAVPLVTGTPAVLMAPFSFVQQPVRWLRAVSEHRATHTVSPNFGLDLCVERITQRAREGLDLSSLRAMVNGSEPVRAATLDRFTEHFTPYGFRHEAHSPGYGLAEATLAVTIGRPAAPRVLTLDRAELAAGRVRVLEEADRPEGPADGYRVVACGSPADQEVLVVDPDTLRPVADGRTGEVWVRGANVCAGYWQRPARTEEVFRAQPVDGGPGWLRTGDLGFLADGELYLTGRLKDLIVVDGRNHYASDLELTAQEAEPSVRRGHVAAFPVGLLGDSGERAVVVAELERRRDPAELDAVRTAIRTALLARHSLDVQDVVLIRRGTMPKTTSGKIRRSACRDAYLAGTLVTAAHDRAGHVVGAR
ncbi:fatty acyl-AMP ligase [Streptomyces coeruleoprunus]|uniref:Fatty acyl-AMP ligase n=1 Tax=Streptomyces coeruleoprunus TaxID=285563 RepID=A0ABV9XBL0_9ACTN